MNDWIIRNSLKVTIKGHKMRMYLDDLRTPTEEYDFIARSYDEAIDIITRCGIPDFISFDHDLGIDKKGELLKTGYDLAKWIIDADIDGFIEITCEFTYKVHSQNPVGRQNIISIMENYLGYKRKNYET